MDTDDMLRRALILNGIPEKKLVEALRQDPNSVVNTEDFKKQYEAVAFLAPFVEVRRKSDGVVGLLMFTHLPRYYFNFVSVEELRRDSD
jgi:hypothetical protein